MFLFELLIKLFISILPVYLIGKYVMKKWYNKKNFKFLALLFFCGFISTLIVIISSLILSNFFPFILYLEGMTFIELILYCFIFVAFIEEISKWIFSYKLSYNSRHFLKLYDVVVYSVFVALGFACIENIIYVFQRGILIGVFRAFTAVPLHACCGVIMGYYLGLSKYYNLYNNKRLMKKNLILSFLIPILVHGFYDFCIFANKNITFIIVIIFVVILYKKSLKLIKCVSSIRRKIKYDDNFCSDCGTRVESDYCPMCGRKNN